MKLKTTIVYLGLLNSLHAFAAGNEASITVKGQVVTAACQVSSDSTNKVVSLGEKIMTSTFKNKGDMSTSVQFYINLEKCPQTTSSARFKFDGTADKNNANLLALDNIPDSATGVGVGIYDATGKIVPLWTASSSYPLTGGNNALSFTARYVASVVPVTPGEADATTQFTLNYQ